MAQNAFQHVISETPSTQAKDLRRFARAPLYLLGRYMLADRLEYPCQTRNLSMGGVALYAPVLGAAGERVVLYLDQIGRLEGKVVRAFPSGFAMEFAIPGIKREKLAEQIGWLTSASALGLSEARKVDTGASPEITNLRLLTGETFRSEVIDVSLSGVSVKFDGKLPLGARIVAGKTLGRVVRNFEGGIAIEFLAPVQKSGPYGAIHF